MFHLEKLFGKLTPKDKTLDKDKIARMLKDHPEALEAFEQAYTAAALTGEPGSPENAKQAAAKNERLVETSDRGLLSLIDRIVDELTAQTTAYVYDGESGKTVAPLALPDGTAFVSNTDIAAYPVELRPQLSGNLMKVDISASPSEAIMVFWEKMQNAKTEEERKFAYNHFRQGLDILDLDALTYAIIGLNPNSMGYWLPALVDACRNNTFFRIPATTVVRVPITLLQLTRCEYSALTPSTIAIVDKWAHRVFHLNDEKDYFVKTGVYSSKYDFRNCHIHGAKEVQELGEYLLYTHYQALQMASPLHTPCIHSVSTTNEWVVRDFIEDVENNLCIYKGMPLHTEYRLFVDCDTDEVLSIVPYWDPETMLKRFSEPSGEGSPHQKHDYITYKAHEETLMRRYYENRNAVTAQVEELLPALNLHGQWSIDVMQNGSDFWLIDMAMAENSYYYDSIPQEKRRPAGEKWIPKLTK